MKKKTKILDEFYKQINKKNLSDFLRFVALHPEVSIDNCALLYASNPDANKIPRYFVHKGQADSLKIETAPQAMLRVKNLHNNNLGYSDEILYPYAGNKANSNSIREVLQRIGYSCAPDSDLQTVLCKDNIIYYPMDWNQEQIDSFMVDFFVNYFWIAFKKRYLQTKYKPVIDVTDEVWVKYYREAIIYMVRVFLHMTNPTLTNHFYLFIKNDDILPNMNISEKRYRLTILSVIFSEFVQIIEGEHFTLFETDIFRGCNGNIYDEKYVILYKDRRFLDIVYNLMMERYFNTNIDQIPVSYVHLYEPFSIRQKYN